LKMQYQIGAWWQSVARQSWQHILGVDISTSAHTRKAYHVQTTCSCHLSACLL